MKERMKNKEKKKKHIENTMLKYILSIKTLLSFKKIPFEPPITRKDLDLTCQSFVIIQASVFNFIEPLLAEAKEDSITQFEQLLESNKTISLKSDVKLEDIN